MPNYRARSRPPLYLVVHCADTVPSQDVGAQEIRGWHVTERGWIDIGYHLVIRRSGVTEPGRPLWAVGAHVEGWNSVSVAVCLVGGRKEGTGTKDVPAVWENNFLPAQWAALGLVLRDWKGLWPSAVVQGHRDFPRVAKQCPSFDVRAWWSQARLPTRPRFIRGPGSYHPEQ